MMAQVILIDLSVNPDIIGLQEGESCSPLQAGISITKVQVTTCVSDARYSDSLTQRHALLLAGHGQGHHVGGRGQGTTAGNSAWTPCPSLTRRRMTGGSRSSGRKTFHAANHSEWLALGTSRDHHPGAVATVPGPAQGGISQRHPNNREQRQGGRLQLGLQYWVKECLLSRLRYSFLSPAS